MADWTTLADRVLGSAMRPFRETATYTPSGGSPVQVSGVFDAAHQEVRLDDGGVMVSSVEPVFGVRSSELTFTPAVGDQLTVRGAAYRVVDVRPDGSAGVSLALEAI